VIPKTMRYFMRIESGTTRIAFIGKKSTLKLPSPVPPFRVMRGSIRALFAGRGMAHILKQLQADEDQSGSLKYSL